MYIYLYINNIIDVIYLYYIIDGATNIKVNKINYYILITSIYI